MQCPNCCDESRDVYERYYDRKKNGKGEFMSTWNVIRNEDTVSETSSALFRKILPALKAVVPHVLRTGANVLEDVAEEKSLKKSAIKRIPGGLRSVRIRDKMPRVLSAGANVIDDVSGGGGKSLKESAMKRIPEIFGD
jgi:hypothetical protein